MVFPIVGGNQSTGDFVTNSLRFNNDDSAYLEKSLSSPNTDKFTVSFWVKISGQRANIFSIGKRLVGQTGDYFSIDVDLGTGTGSGRLSISGYNGNSDTNTLAVNTGEATGPVFRDSNAWQHHVYAIDTGQGTAGNRFKWYVNGVLQSEYNTTTTPSQNVDLFDASGSAFRIGRLHNDESRYMDGYLAEFYYVDGQQYDHTYFGEFNDNGIWIPVENGKGAGGAITFGTNGFYLQFQETGTSANASGIGADTSGNDNHLTPSNLAALDVVTDTPQNNFATLNPLDNAVLVLSEGNTKATHSDSGGGEENRATLGAANGKWYFEFQIQHTVQAYNPFAVGMMSNTGQTPLESDLKTTEAFTSAWHTDSSTNRIESRVAGSLTSLNCNLSYPDSGDIVQVAMDLDNGRVFFGKNGTYIQDASSNTGNPSTGANPAVTFTTNNHFYFPAIHNRGSQGLTLSLNTGQPSFSISSGNSDANGHGNFEYEVPTGYFALCTKNLAEHG